MAARVSHDAGVLLTASALSAGARLHQRAQHTRTMTRSRMDPSWPVFVHHIFHDRMLTQLRERWRVLDEFHTRCIVLERALEVQRRHMRIASGAVETGCIDFA